MTKKVAFTLLIASMALFACNKQTIDEAIPVLESKPLTAAFTIQNPNQVVNEKEVISIQNSSENAVAYRWEFADKTLTEKNPTISFPIHGIYPIRLTVTGADGSSQTFSQEVTVLCVFGGVHDPF